MSLRVHHIFVLGPALQRAQAVMRYLVAQGVATITPLCPIGVADTAGQLAGYVATCTRAAS